MNVFQLVSTCQNYGQVFEIIDDQNQRVIQRSYDEDWINDDIMDSIVHAWVTLSDNKIRIYSNRKV